MLLLSVNDFIHKLLLWVKIKYFGHICNKTNVWWYFTYSKLMIVTSVDEFTCWDKRCEPMAMVTERTVGIAIGIPPMSSTRRLSIPTRYSLWWIPYITMISIIIPTTIEQMQKFPIEVNTFQKQKENYKKSYVLTLKLIIEVHKPTRR